VSAHRPAAPQPAALRDTGSTRHVSVDIHGTWLGRSGSSRVLLRLEPSLLGTRKHRGPSAHAAGLRQHGRGRPCDSSARGAPPPAPVSSCRCGSCRCGCCIHRCGILAGCDGGVPSRVCAGPTPFGWGRSPCRDGRPPPTHFAPDLQPCGSTRRGSTRRGSRRGGLCPRGGRPGAGGGRCPHFGAAASARTAAAGRNRVRTSLAVAAAKPQELKVRVTVTSSGSTNSCHCCGSTAPRCRQCSGHLGRGRPVGVSSSGCTGWSCARRLRRSAPCCPHVQEETDSAAVVLQRVSKGAAAHPEAAPGGLRPRNAGWWHPSLRPRAWDTDAEHGRTSRHLHDARIVNVVEDDGTRQSVGSRRVAATAGAAGAGAGRGHSGECKRERRGHIQLRVPPFGGNALHNQEFRTRAVGRVGHGR